MDGWTFELKLMHIVDDFDGDGGDDDDSNNGDGDTVTASIVL